MAFPDGILKTIVGGVQGNLWNNAGVSINGDSAVFDTSGCKDICIHGNASGASTLTVWWSADGTTFNASGSTVAANGDFALQVTGGARYLRVRSSAAVTITATATAKA